MSDILLPVVSAMLVLMIPICTRFIVKKIGDKLDEGRAKAEERAEKTEKLLTAYQTAADAIATARHEDNVERFDRIELHTSTTNGKVAELDKTLIKHEAKIEVLLALATKGQPE